MGDAAEGLIDADLRIQERMEELEQERRAAKKAGPNPWEAPTLEWATSSPPPDYNFAKIPTLTRMNPLWDEHPDAGH